MSARALVSLAALCVAGRAAALDPARPISAYARSEWTEANGLSGGDLVSLGQTRDGYLWIGTGAGLVRFDGRVFTPVPQTISVLGYYPRAQAHALDGALWVVGERGAVRIAGDDLQLVDAWMPGTLLRAVAPARRGGVWVGSNGAGFVRLDGNRVAERPPPSPLDHAMVTALVETADALWVATLDDGLYRYPHGDLTQPPARVSALPGTRTLFLDSHGTLWIGYTGGLARLDGDRFVPLAAVDKHTINVIAEDRDGALWLGSTDGLYRLRGETVDRPAAGDVLHNGLISSLLFDDAGGLLVTMINDGTMVRLADSAIHGYGGPGMGGTTNGLCRERDGSLIVVAQHLVLRLRGERFVPVAENPADAEHGLMKCAAADGTVFVGGEGGLLRVDGSQLVPVPLAPHGRSLHGMITALEPARDGGVWIGAQKTLLHRAPDGTLTVFDAQSGFAPVGDVSRIVPGGDGRPIVATGFIVYEALWAVDGARIRRIDDGSQRWSSLARDSDGTVWAAAQQGTFAHVVGGRIVASAVVSGTPPPFVDFLADDGTGHWWLGSHAGLARVPRDLVPDLVAGKDRSLAETIRFFDLGDGLPSLRISEDVHDLHDGRLWLGTDKGPAAIDLSRLDRKSPAPHAVIERVDGDAGARRSADAVVLPAGTRTLSIAYTAPTLVASDHVRFRYRLEGFDRGWIDAGTRRTAQYTALPPGRYVFSLLAGNRDGAWSAAPARVTMEILPRWYQRRSVQALGVLLLVAIVWALYRRRLAQLQARARELSDEVAARTSELRERNAELGERGAELERALESLRLAQADLVRAERMASVAALVRGIAHELNNPIAFIAANVQPLRRYAEFLLTLSQRLQHGVPSPEEWSTLSRYRPGKGLDHVTGDLARLTEDIAEGARRARLIIGDLQHLTDAPSRQIETVDPAALVARTIRLFAASVPEVRIEADVGPVPPLTVYAGQIEQALTNLIDNAVKARPRDGMVQVRLGATADAVTLAVIDHGQGMTDEVRRRALEPFFTTRTAGEGSGLGLAIVSAVVAAHHGGLAIDSEPGRGTTVTMTLPLQTA